METRSVDRQGGAFGVSRAGVGSDCQDRERQGGRDRADMDVLVASPGYHYPPWLPTENTVGQYRLKVLFNNTFKSVYCYFLYFSCVLCNH